MLSATAINQRHFYRSSNLYITASSNFATCNQYNMPSSKGEPTDPELREQVKEEVKAEEKGRSIPFPILSR